MKRPQSWPKAIIFDLDGTLMDSAPDIAAALNRTFSENGFQTFAVKEVRLMIGGGAKKLIERALEAAHVEFEPGLVEQLLARFVEIYAAAASVETTLYPNVKEVLNDLKEAGYKIGLCTNKPQEITLIVLKAFGLLDYFQSVVGSRPEFQRKPDPGSLRHVLSELGVTADEALLIGDSGADVGVARAVDMAVYIMSYGYSKIPPSQLRADGVLNDLIDVAALLAHEERRRTS